MSDQIFSRILNLKFKHYMGSRFNCKAEFILAENSSKPSQSILESALRNPSAPLILTGSKMMIPFKVQGSLVGVAVIFNMAQFDLTEIEEIRLGTLNYLEHISWDEDYLSLTHISGTGLEHDSVLWLFA